MTRPLLARTHAALRTVRTHPVALDAHARLRLRHAASVGARPRVVGSPLIHSPELHIGDDLLCWSVHRRTHFGGSGRIDLGDRVFVNSGAVVLGFDQVTIEDDVGLASEVFITDSDNHPIGDRAVRQAPVHIGAGAWIATRAMVLAGVTIGPRSVVAAGSVVTRDVPADTLVAGSPARVIRTIDYAPGQHTAWRGRP